MAAGAAAVLGSGAMVSLCEPEAKPQYHKCIKDPNTIYAIHALKRETQEQDRLAAADGAQEKMAEDQPQSAGKVGLVASDVVEDNVEPQATLQATWP